MARSLKHSQGPAAKPSTIGLALRALAVSAVVFGISSSNAHATALLTDPDDVSAIAVVAVGAAPRNIDVYIDGGPPSSDPNTACVSGDGGEICFWDVRFEATGGMVIHDFIPDPNESAIVQNAPPALGANGGDPANGPQGIHRIGTLSVSASSPGTVIVTGKQAVLADFSQDDILARNLIVADGDADDDGMADEADNCALISNAAQEASSQDPSVGCACLCGDVTGDCIVNVLDALRIQQNLADSPPGPYSVLPYSSAHANVDGLGPADRGNAADALAIQNNFSRIPGPYPSPPFSTRNCGQEPHSGWDGLPQE